MPPCVANRIPATKHLYGARCCRLPLVRAPVRRHAGTSVGANTIHQRHVKGRRQCASRSAAADISTADTEVIKSVKDRKYVMVSGKGGVGKTSLSSSLAIKFAEAGHTTLIVSTDPAHSLGDSLGQLLPGGIPVPIEGTALPLWGMEIDPDRATDEFKTFAATKGKAKVQVGNIQGMLDRVGMGKLMDTLSDLKLDELLSTPPPGLDEAVAISKVVEFVESEEYARFTRIVFDTAPTGHTLRMLSLPDFVAATLKKVQTLQRKLGTGGPLIQAIFGNPEGLQSSAKQLQELERRVLSVSRLFRDKERMDFVVATIPTMLALEESARLVAALRAEDVPVSTMVVNQVVGESMGAAYLGMKLKEQEAALRMLEASPHLAPLEVVRGRQLDLEVRGLPALQYVAGAVWAGMPLPAGGAGEGLVRASDRRFYLLGGKGGVGKTTMSSALGMHLSTQQVPTLIVSTDPAHSLSDSLGQDVSGGLPVRLQGTEAPLWGMQIDPERARAELRELARGDGGDKAMDMLRSVGLGSLAEQLQDLKLGELLDNPPPGVDEAVAISQVVRLMKNPDYAQFRAVVFDTAPTGHTLRLLTLPDFLNTGVGKVVRLRFAISGAVSGVSNFFSGKSGNTVDEAMQSLEQLQESLEEARQLFRDQERTEFVIVTIPTVMAMAESERLAASLQSEGVPVKRIVVNQLVDDAATEKFLKSRRQDQQRALEFVRENPDLRELTVKEAPLLDLEVRGVPALQYFGNIVWPDANEDAEAAAEESD